MMNRRAFSLISLIVIWLGAAAQVAAQERILSFHSDIQIHADASMTVTETIRVQAEGRTIRRGIYREFPTRYRDQYGNRVVVDFEVLTLTRDGQAEVYDVSERLNGVRIDFGGDDLLPVPAQYEYALTYRTHRQIGYFEDHDELYWNVTGLGWKFQIDQASADIRLPQPVSASALTIEGYTGPARATAQDYQAALSDGRSNIVTTSPLPPYSGLTVVMTFPKGLVETPGTVDKLGYLLIDNRGVLFALCAFLLALAWLLWIWNRVGRDPKKGVIFPHYQPPEALSPAACRFIYHMGYDTKTFSAAVVNLAVKGYININQQQKSFSLQKRESAQVLSTDEQKLLTQLFANEDLVKLENENHQTLRTANRAHKNVLANAYGEYFSTNARYLIPSLLFVLLMTTLIVIQQAMVPLAAGLTALSLGMHVIFWKLLKAPSIEGRRLMDKLEGFRLYLETAEKDDLNQAHPPALTPAVFEQFLPYAIALGVEQEWAKSFEKALEGLEQEDSLPYHPTWYYGAFNAARLTAFSSAIGSSMSAAIASASTPPGSASGAGGGGFSGGGGGGGGGGGR